MLLSLLMWPTCWSGVVGFLKHEMDTRVTARYDLYWSHSPSLLFNYLLCNLFRHRLRLCRQICFIFFCRLVQWYKSRGGWAPRRSFISISHRLPKSTPPVINGTPQSFRPIWPTIDLLPLTKPKTCDLEQLDAVVWLWKPYTLNITLFNKQAEYL